jgi:hypothetical protein
MSHKVEKEGFRVIREGGTQIITNRRNFIRRAELKTQSPEVCRERRDDMQEMICKQEDVSTTHLEHMLRSIEGEDTPCI